MELLNCNHNKNLKPWAQGRRFPGCPEPLSCDEGPRLQIADSWQMRRNGKAVYGFVGTVHMPPTMAEKPWSVLVRFSPLVTGHNMQTWNGRYWNFYNGNRDVVFHKKWWNGDRQDEVNMFEHSSRHYCLLEPTHLLNNF